MKVPFGTPVFLLPRPDRKTMIIPVNALGVIVGCDFNCGHDKPYDVVFECRPGKIIAMSRDEFAVKE